MDSAPAPDELPPAYYEQVGEQRFRSTLATQSPWDFQMQHGGPPSALLTRCVERYVDDDTMRPARLSTDFLGPIPQGDLDVEVETVRPGKRVRLVRATLSHAGRSAVVLNAWLIHREHQRVAPIDATAPAPPLPAEQDQRYFKGVDPSWGYGRSVEWRYVTGAFDEPGPATVWTRVRPEIVAGEEPSGLQRLMVVADSTNGVSGPIHVDGWLFIPPGLTVTAMREPVGEWIYLDAQTQTDHDGIGIAHATLMDADGFLGYATQPLLIAPV